ncbi:HD domain-containing protein [Mariniradius sediminis]|uniref:HD domain-containing protein n=1 Tax=Mariniradius sediminis TaxID=2909237 RepID=A0ABS9BRW6_9BACT|nr:HD domain-containing protein [Mariniradius sediminis]MCF1749693.1 HD domain-containing protein [Mariniradius sediminis]
MKEFLNIKKEVLSMLESDLPSSLKYHDMSHIMDVYDVCNQYIDRLKLPEQEACELRIGALMHDIGFTQGNSNHEEVGAKMAEEILRKYNVGQPCIESVQGLILATKIPQSPTNELQKIICDADLDYLGRDDYPEISSKLFEELKLANVIRTEEEWKNIQVRFLKAHQFHTDFAKKNREPKKQYWLRMIENS